MTTRQFDEAIDAIRCDPAPPTNDTLYPPVASRCRTPRRYCRTPAGLSMRSSAAAWTVARCRLRLPSSLRIAGRTNTSNDTSALTGLPGRQKIGTSVAEMAEALRLARLHRDPGEVDRPEFGQRLLDHVEGAHARRRRW